MLETVLYCRFKCELVQGRDVHRYETRGRENYRTDRHRTVTFEHLPAQVGVRLLNKLPEEIKTVEIQKKFKARLQSLLACKAFYSIDEFMDSRWD